MSMALDLTQRLRLLNQALQSCELLKLSFLEERSSKETARSNDVKVRDLISSANEALREAKRLMEHNDTSIYISTVMDKMMHKMEKLRYIRLTYQGSTLPESLRNETVNLMREVMQEKAGTSIEVLFVALSTCPWHAISQREPGQKAKHNRLVAVYSLPSTTFWNVQSTAATALIEMDGVLAIEMCSFLQHIVRGHVTYVEFLHFPSSSCLIRSANWQSLISVVSKILLDLPAFVAQCHGQAIGSVSKKARRGVKEIELDHQKASYAKLCESLRLLCHVEMLQKGSLSSTVSLVMEEAQIREASLSETGEACLKHITRWTVDLTNGQQGTVDCGFDKKELLELMVAWNQQLLNLNDKQSFPAKSNTLHRVEEILGDWHCAVKLKQTGRLALQHLDKDKQQVAEQLIRPLGGFAARLCSNSAEDGRILLVARAGSFMYNLNVADSDADYIVLYAIDAEQEVRDAAKASARLGSHENRGPNKQVEYGAYEARIFAEMLLKGSVVMLELVFVLAQTLKRETSTANFYRADIVTPTFCELCDQLAEGLVNETSVRQFLGLVEHNLRTLRTGRWCHDPKKETKMLYQVHHKLLSIEQMCNGQMPTVFLDESSVDRKRILAIRRNSYDPEEWSIQRTVMIAEAETNLSAVRRQLAERSSRFAEMLDERLVTKWLMRTRGLQVEY